MTALLKVNRVHYGEVNSLPQVDEVLLRHVDDGSRFLLLLFLLLLDRCFNLLVLSLDLLSHLGPVLLILLEVGILPEVVHLLLAVLFITDSLIIKLQFMGHSILRGDQIEFLQQRRIVPELLLPCLHQSLNHVLRLSSHRALLQLLPELLKDD